jgi:hypothetical protein
MLVARVSIPGCRSDSSKDFLFWEVEFHHLDGGDGAMEPDKS